MATKPDRTEVEDKILEAAGEVFAEQGFQGATVRDICARAGTNIASINYYFSDKAALYGRVLRYSHEVACANFPVESVDAARTSPEERLYNFILNFLGRLIEKSDSSWHGRLMAREMIEPTPALNELIESGIKPHFTVLREIVSLLLAKAANDEQVRMSAGSVIGQCLHYHHCRHVIAKLSPELTLCEDNREKIARHISNFTISALAGLASSRTSTNH